MESNHQNIQFYPLFMYCIAIHNILTIIIIIHYMLNP